MVYYSRIGMINVDKWWYYNAINVISRYSATNILFLFSYVYIWILLLIPIEYFDYFFKHPDKLKHLLSCSKITNSTVE